MNQKTLVIHHRNKRYVAGIFTSKGLFATSLPRDTREDAIAAVNGEGIPLRRAESELRVLDIVFDLYDGQIPSDLTNIRLDFSGLTTKQIDVLKATLTIPRGKTMTYGQVAEKAGFKGAARFVGNVMATNRFAPIIPCHRVVGVSGMGGYSLGIDIKIALLHKEGAIID